jgi:hypothetical protein
MDGTISPVSGAIGAYTPPAIKSTTVTVSTASTPSTQTAALAPAAQQAAPSAVNGSASAFAQSEHDASLRQAALSFKNVYALGDQQFSIFKDVTGKYITRYVSERDGKITYSPEPTFSKPIDIGSTGSRVTISA